MGEKGQRPTSQQMAARRGDTAQEQLRQERKHEERLDCTVQSRVDRAGEVKGEGEGAGGGRGGGGGDEEGEQNEE